MAKMYYDQDADLSLLKDKTIGIIGYGSQGHAQALNLRDSGSKVIVAEAPGSNAWKAAEKAGFSVSEAAEVAREADIIVLLAPDDLQPQIYHQSIEPALTAGKTLQFAHGFNIYYHQIVPPPDIDVTMVAPKIHGVLLRKLYTENQGPPGSVAVYQDASGKAMPLALAYAKAIGCTRGGVVETTFKEETVTDIFNEQCGIGGGVVGLLKAGWEVLVEAGYSEETAYLELFHELKGVADLINSYGIPGMIRRCSQTAQFGIMSRQHRVIDDSVRENMRRVLREIEDGTFAHQWLLEGSIGHPNYLTLLSMEDEHGSETAGRKLRELMPWLTRP
jgi:ketol-acid reductoisomerase